MFATQGTQTQLLRKFEFARDEIDNDIGPIFRDDINKYHKNIKKEFAEKGIRGDIMDYLKDYQNKFPEQYAKITPKLKSQITKKLELERDINFAQREIPNLPSKESTIRRLFTFSI